MKKKKLNLPRNLANSLLISSTLMLLLTSNVLAEYTQEYSPPPEANGSDASRNDGCLKDEKLELTILAPISRIGQTVSLQPTLTWYLPNTEVRDMELVIYDYDQTRPIGEKSSKKLFKKTLTSKPGETMNVSLSKEEFQFERGKSYLWQITLLCDRNNPMKYIYTEAVVKIVSTPPSIASQLSQETNPLKRAQIYIDAGYWYDALAELPANPQGEVLKSKILIKLSELESNAAVNAQKREDKQKLEAQALKLKRLADRKK